LVANSAWAEPYLTLLQVPIAVQVAEFEIHKPLLLWINDGLMALFFLLVGLELKREWLIGELADTSQVVLPALAALGGMAMPAVLYVAINAHDASALRGWAIPAATDIAFALGILSLLGPRVPLSLKVFLTSLAIFDDVGAIVIIALFYTADLSVQALTVAAFAVLVLWALNHRRVMQTSLYLLVGGVLWVAMLKSGVHATLAGVVIALFIPMQHPLAPSASPLRQLEHSLHPWVAYMVLPIFAFANAGLNLRDLNAEQILHSVTLGVAAGLFIGKQMGVMLCCWLAIRLGWARLPRGATWLSLYGIAVLTGVGFTMSLFIGGLAFVGDTAFDERLGIVLGSLLSGVVGYGIVKRSLRH
ncbi:MAG: Na+/H+ antiporter NhaA, partial [Limnohabitans sp.]|nr:Na+/H+ antiporter NhaA [Limnohabitans sp.]